MTMFVFSSSFFFRLPFRLFAIWFAPISSLCITAASLQMWILLSSAENNSTARFVLIVNRPIAQQISAESHHWNDWLSLSVIWCVMHIRWRTAQSTWEIEEKKHRGEYYHWHCSHMKLCLYIMEMCVMPILLSIQFDAICDRWSYSVFIGNANVRMFADPSAIWLQLLLFCYFVFCFFFYCCLFSTTKWQSFESATFTFHPPLSSSSHCHCGVTECSCRRFWKIF